MGTQLKFNECLELLLSALDVSSSRLSKAINVDSSLVYRWLSGKRVPSYNSSHIEKISGYLSHCVINSTQEKRMNEIMANMCTSIKNDMSIKDKIRLILLEAQGNSIENKKNIKESGKSQSLFPSYNRPLHAKKKQYVISQNYKSKNGINISSFHLSSEDRIISGNRSILKAALDLVQCAASQPGKKGRVIYFSYNNEYSMINPFDSMVEHLGEIVLGLLKNGWHIICLLRPTNNLDRTIKLIKSVQPLVGTGRFYAYHLNRYDTFTAGKELMIIPGTGALSCFATMPDAPIDSAFYFKTPKAVSILIKYFNTLLKLYTQPILKYYNTGKDMNCNFCYVLSEVEESPGRRFLYKDEFSILTLTRELYCKLLMKEKHTADEIRKSMYTYEKRLDSFLTNVQKYDHIDIYSVDSLENMVKYRRFCFYNCGGVSTIELEVQDIINILQNIIQLLKSIGRYHIAFVHPSMLNRGTKSESTCCIVKERKAVLLDVLNASAGISKVKLSIQEPLLVKAFEKYFEEIYDRIAPVYKDKSEVIIWLQSKVDSLKE